MENISLYLAFIAGLFSFLSPCVLPIIPGYICFIGGISLEKLKESLRQKQLSRKVFINSLLFILGFSIIFVILGAAATVLGQFFLQRLNFLMKAAGLIIIIFGLHTLGIFNLHFLNFEKRLQITNKPFGYFGSFLIGAAFAFGWAPCVGPILAGILTLAANEKTIQRGIILLSVYSLGLALPFLLTAIFLQYFFNLFKRLKRYFHLIEMVSGFILIIIGGLILTNNLQWIIR